MSCDHAVVVCIKTAAGHRGFLRVQPQVEATHQPWTGETLASCSRSAHGSPPWIITVLLPLPCGGAGLYNASLNVPGGGAGLYIMLYTCLL